MGFISHEHISQSVNLWNYEELLEEQKPQLPDLRPQTVLYQLWYNSSFGPPDPLPSALWLPVTLQKLFILS